MSQELTVTHEPVDDLPVLIALLLKLRVAELIDQHFPTNGNRKGLTLGQMCVIWLTFILSEANHRLCQVEPWVAARQTVLSACLGVAVTPADCTDDRLATGLDYLCVLANWRAFETALNHTIIRTYELQPERVRLDTTTASATVDAAGLFQFGHSKDHRPDLPQLKIMVSTLDPIGLPLTTTVVAGNAADDPLYLPEIRRLGQSLGRPGLTHIGDSKMSALATRSGIVAQGDFYLCPLSAVQLPSAELDRLLAPVWAGTQPLQSVYLPTPDALPEEEPDPDDKLAVGFELTVQVTGQTPEGIVQVWHERRLLLRSLSFANSQAQGLHKRLARAQQEIAALNQRKQGKARLHSVAEVEAAACQIAAQQRVSELLRLEVRQEVKEREKRAWGRHPAQILREESFCVRALVEEDALEAAIRRLGWRVYVTNHEGAQMPLEKAVWAYREQYLVEQGFGRLKGAALSLTPFFLQYEHRIVGLLHLLTIALRVLVLAQFTVREKLREKEETLSGIYPGQPGRQTKRPTTEMMLRTFCGVVLSCVTLPGEIHWYIKPLSDAQQRILKLLGLPPEIFTRLVPANQKTAYHSREP